MGKKKDKKGKGKEKTAQKTEKKAEKRAKKELNEKGEEDIEKLIAEFQEQDRKKTQVIEEKCPPPSPRCSMTLTPHPEKDELIMFGGEFYTGKKMFVYNDLFFYNIKKNEWSQLTSPNPPPPRSAHQAVAVPQAGGQLWVFGGEFSSHSQAQFYHYKDLWVLSLKDRRWERINAPGGPSPRSGHRMVALKKMIMVFGGFHDNARDYKYFNDTYVFDLETYGWTKLEVSGSVPSPRSGCVMAAWQGTQPQLLVYGGYSKERVRRDVDKGTVHSDMFVLAPEVKGKEGPGDRWKWTMVRQSRDRPSPRSGMSIAVIPGSRAFVFGGVFDEEDSDEQLNGVFYNEMFTFELGQGKWFPVTLRGQKTAGGGKKRRRKKEEGDAMEVDGEQRDGGEEEQEEEEEEEMEVAESDLEKLTLKPEDTPAAQPADSDAAADQAEEEEDIFTVKIGPQSSGAAAPSSASAAEVSDAEPFVPSPRMNALLAVKGGALFLYGGMFEEGDKQLTLADMYSLDLHRLAGWEVIVPQDKSSQVWEESDSSGDEEEGMEGAVGGKAEEDNDDDDDDEDDDSDMDIDFEDAPARNADEELRAYFERSVDYWRGKATEFCGVRLSERKQRHLGWELCQQAFKE